MVLVNGFDLGYGGQSETTELTTLLPHATVFDGPSATKDSVLHGLATADVFHFSGHATADAGVVFASAPGAPQSLSPDALDGIHLPYCRLAVLAACNTTAADPDQVEELPDLRNALLLSGRADRRRQQLGRRRPQHPLSHAGLLQAACFRALSHAVASIRATYRPLHRRMAAPLLLGRV